MFGGMGRSHGRMGALAIFGGVRAPQIQITNVTIPDTTASGSLVGTLSVAGGTGTFSLVSNPGTLFAISGASLNTASTLTAGSYPITVRFTGTPTVADKPISVIVTSAGAAFVPTFYFLGF